MLNDIIEDICHEKDMLMMMRSYNLKIGGNAPFLHYAHSLKTGPHSPFWRRTERFVSVHALRGAP